MIYTSMYRQVIDMVAPVLKAKVPSVEVEWLQAGSEKIATRLDAELAAGAPKADLVLTSDPFWYERLDREGHLLAYASVRALAIPRELVDRDGAYVTSRISTMVIAYNTRLVKEAEAPQSFEELFSERWKGKVTIPDPLGSGTAYTTLAFLADVNGLEIVDRMKAVDTIASGGGAATMTRIESGEHQVGFVLLENVLQARRNGSPVGFVVPREGAVLIPGPVAILKKSQNAVAARAVYDALLSDEVQAVIVKGDLHSPFEWIAAPEGTPVLEKLRVGEFQWTGGFVERAIGRTEELRRKFSAVMGGG